MQAITSAPFQCPKGIIDYYRSLLSIGNPTYWYDFSIGYRNKTIIDLSGNGRNATSVSSSAQLDSAWEASTSGGMIHLANSTSGGGYTFKRDGTFLSSDGFIHMGFEYVSMNSTFNVIIGGYDSSTGQRWRVGLGSGGQLHLGINNNQYNFNNSLVTGRKYLLTIRLKYTGGSTSGYGVATLRDNLGNVYQTGYNTINSITGTGATGFATYGTTNYGFYTPNIKIGHVVAWNYEIGSFGYIIESELNRFYARKYGFTTLGAEQDAVDIYSSNTSFPINITYQGSTTADADTPYTVLEKRINVTGSGSSASGRLYVGVRNTATTTFYGDLAISHLQIINPSDPTNYTFRTGSINSATRAYDFSFAISTLGYSLFSTTYNGGQTNSSTAPNTYFYTTVTTSISVNRFGARTSTGSSYTGANNGTYVNSGTSYSGLGINTTTGGALLPVGAHNLNQNSNGSSTRYLFPESSGMTANHITWLRSPTLTVHNGDIIRLAYLATRPASGGLLQNNTLYFRWI